MTRRRAMPQAVRAAFAAELAASRTASTSEARWYALERAHILSQPWAVPHTKAHAAMLGVAWRERNRREAVGQVIRLVVAAPGSALGKYPEGNTGRATVPLTKPLPIPADLAALLASAARCERTDAVTRTVALQTELPLPADTIWQAMQQPATFLYVVRGMLAFPALNRRTAPFQQGETYTGWLLLFHVVPLHRHTITVVAVDPQQRKVQTEERGGLLRRWHHTLAVEPVTEATARYSDTIDIDAGPFTGLMYWSATALFRYRQWRWQRLAATLTWSHKSVT